MSKKRTGKKKQSKPVAELNLSTNNLSNHLTLKHAMYAVIAIIIITVVAVYVNNNAVPDSFNNQYGNQVTGNIVGVNSVEESESNSITGMAVRRQPSGTKSTTLPQKSTSTLTKTTTSTS